MFNPGTEPTLRPGDLILTGTFRDGRSDRPESMLTRDVMTSFGLLPMGHIGDGYSTPRWIDALEPRGEGLEIPNRVHDWLLEVGTLPRWMIDRALHYYMRKSGIGWWKSLKYYVGVRIGSWSGYGKVTDLNTQLRDQYRKEGVDVFLATRTERAAYQRGRLNRIRAANDLPPVDEFHLLYAKEHFGMDMHQFFHGENGVKPALYAGRRMSAKMVDGMEQIIDGFATHWPEGTVEQLAYILATSHHETGFRHQPILEAFARSRSGAARALQRAKDNGGLKWVKSRPYYWEAVDGVHYVGAGHVQLTGRANYAGAIREAIQRKFGLDILADPDLVLRPAISIYILIEGMRRGDTGKADFTGDALEDHVNAEKVDYEQARTVVNPGDKPTFKSIARYARKFEAALRGAGWKNR